MKSQPEAWLPRMIAFAFVVGVLSSQLAEAGDVLRKVVDIPGIRGHHTGVC